MSYDKSRQIKNFKGLCQYRAPLNYELAGQTLQFVLDGVDGRQSFAFQNKTQLVMDFMGIRQQNYYEALKIDDEVYFVHFEVENQTPRRCISFVYDAETNQITLFFAKQGHYKEYIRKVEREIYFGAVIQEDGSVPEGRACFTEDLVGESVDWSYTMRASFRHHYLDAHTFQWETVRESKGKKFRGEKSSCDYVRVNNHIYIFSWLEIAAGVQGFCVENLDRMYHVGGFFGVGPDDLPECYLMSAFGREPEE